ncbi:MAG: hypothetical protein GXX85_02095 [Ignavibacteria bacterium]|nr:hypothetical protein [Ignavibacteria bacterium]
MKTSKVILYNRYKKDKDGKVKKVQKEKFSRAVCLLDTLQENKFKDADSFLTLATKMFDDKNQVDEKKQNASWETYRIWRILTPVLLKLEVEIPDYLQ